MTYKNHTLRVIDMEAENHLFVYEPQHGFRGAYGPLPRLFQGVLYMFPAILFWISSFLLATHQPKSNLCVLSRGRHRVRPHRQVPCKQRPAGLGAEIVAHQAEI